MTSTAAGKLEVVVTNETAAVWMAINNCVPGWPPGKIPSGNYLDRYWNGFIYKIPKEYKSFTTGTNVQNLGSIKIITASGDVTVTDGDLAAGKWVQVVVAKSGRTSDPMPVNLAWATLQGTFHKHVDPYDGGLLVWDGREPCNMVGRIPTGSTFWSEYTFTFMTGPHREGHEDRDSRRNRWTGEPDLQSSAVLERSVRLVISAAAPAS
jgi:hypothetical protein